MYKGGPNKTELDVKSLRHTKMNDLHKREL